MGFYYYFLDVYEWCLLSSTIISAFHTASVGTAGRIYWRCCCAEITGDVIEGEVEPAGKHSACSLQGAWSAAEVFCWEMDECFTSSTWDSLNC